MKLSAPKKPVFWISVILVGLGILGSIIDLPFVSGNLTTLVIVGYIVLFLGNVLKGF